MLGYRSFLTTTFPADSLIDESVRSFREWLKNKGGRRFDGDLLEFDQVTRFASDVVALMITEQQPDGSRAMRATLTETNDAGRWTTRFTSGVPREGEPWVWIDIDGPASLADGSGRQQWVSTPNLARALLSHLDVYDGVAAVQAKPIRAFEEDVDEIIDMICDPDRRGLLFIAGMEEGTPLQVWLDKVADVTKETVGLAGTYVLDSAATRSLNAQLETTHGVPPGTIRTYKSGADPASKTDALRHKILGQDRLAADRASYLSKILGWSARNESIERSLPRTVVRLDGRFESATNEIFLTRNQVLLYAQSDANSSPASGVAPVEVESVISESPPRPAEAITSADQLEDVASPVDSPSWLTALVLRIFGPDLAGDELALEIELLRGLQDRNRASTDSSLQRERMDELTERATSAEESVRDLSSRLDDEKLDHAETFDQLQQSEGVNKQLRLSMSQAGLAAEAWSVEPGQMVDVLPDSFEDLLARIGELTFAAFTGDPDCTLALDEHDPLGTWAGKTWKALQALNGYAQLKSELGFQGNLESYLEDSRHNSPKFSRNRYAPGESEDVNNSERLRNARVFPVPVHVKAEGSVHMMAHIKIAQSGLVSPRLHFWDSTANDGKIYVGYIGRHLPTKRTN